MSITYDPLTEPAFSSGPWIPGDSILQASLHEPAFYPQPPVGDDPLKPAVGSTYTHIPDTTECAICYETCRAYDKTITSCGHVMCSVCIHTSWKMFNTQAYTMKNPTYPCPICRENIKHLRYIK